MSPYVKVALRASAKLLLLCTLVTGGLVACKQARQQPTGTVPSEPASGTAEPPSPTPPPSPPTNPPAARETDAPAAPAPGTAADSAAAAAPNAAADAEGPPPDDQPGLGVVLASKLNVRKSTNLTPQSVAGSLRCGDVIDIKGKEGDWYKVELRDELAGFAHSSYIVRMRPGGHSPKCEFSFAKNKAAAASKGDRPLPTTSQRNKNSVEARDGTAAPEAGGTDVKAVAGTASPPGGLVKQPTSTTEAVRPSTARPAPAKPEPASAAAAVIIEKGPSTIMFSGREDGAKPVSFPHQMHQRKYECVKCHHPVSMANGGLTRSKIGDANANKKCRSCHVPEGSAQVRPTSKDVFHGACRDCHSVVGGKAPTGCPQCHK